MIKIEGIELVLGKTPEELKDKCRAFMVRMTEERKKNVAVSSVPFCEGIKARIPVVTKDSVGVIFCFDDYVLTPQEAGPAKHHPDEAEGISLVGPDAPRSGRRR